MRRRQITSVVAIGAWIALRPAASLAHPAPLAPALAIRVDPVKLPNAYVKTGALARRFVPVSLTGTGLGSGNGAGVEVRTGDCATVLHTLTPLARDRCWDAGDLPCVVQWTDDRIVLKLRHPAPNVTLQHTDGGPCVPVDYYGYDWFPTNVDGQSAGAPLAVTVDSQHRVWVNEEFHQDFVELSPSRGVARKIPIPRASVAPFATNLFATDSARHFSSLGEDILLDPQERVWLSEGGGFMYGTLYGGAHPNHSRIIMYDPATAETRVYNIPGDDNEVTGLAYDERCTDGTSTGRHCRDGTPCAAGESCEARIWFLESARRAAKTFLERLPRACATFCAASRNLVTHEVLPPRLAWFSAQPATTPYGKNAAAQFDPGHCIVRARVCANQGCLQDSDCPAPCGSETGADLSGCAFSAAAGCPDAHAGFCVNWSCTSDSDCDTACHAGTCSDSTGRSCAAATVATDCRGLCVALGNCADTQRACLTDNDCSLERQVCDWGSTRADCFFREYTLSGRSAAWTSLSGFFQPGHLLIGRDGAVWYTAYAGGNHVGRLVPEQCDRANPSLCRVEIFPLPAPRGTHHAVPLAGAGPWQIVEADNGDIIFSEFFDNSISRLHVARLTDPQYDCRKLDGSAQNPCMTEAVVRVGNPAAVQLHSLAFDEQGRLWFTQSTDVCSKTDRTAESSIGYIHYPTPETPEVFLFPPLSLYQFDPPGGFCGDDEFHAFVGTGIAVDRATGEIWFADLLRRRIGRLQRTALTGGDDRQ